MSERERFFQASIHLDEKGNWFFNRHAYDTGPYDSAQELCEELGKLLDQEKPRENCHHPYWKQLPGGKEVCQRCGADVSHMDGMGG
jgi:hypothetical protein